MGGPAWLTGVFAAMMLTVAAYCSGRLIAARRWRRPTEVDADGGHVLMGVAMAGMLVAHLRVMPAGVWEAAFAAGAAWFGAQTLRARRGAPISPWRCPQPAPHLVECAAMIYMFLLLPASLAGRGTSTGMSGMTTSASESRFSFLALLMALFMFGYVVRVADRLTARAPALALPGARPIQAATPGPAAGPIPAAGQGPLPAAPPSPAGCAATGPRLADPRLAGPYLAPRCAALCKIAMGITMGYMLIMML
jgi:Domain of unknown function (DUF5134)